MTCLACGECFLTIVIGQPSSWCSLLIGRSYEKRKAHLQLCRNASTYKKCIFVFQFLGVICSSRSDFVTKSVCPFVTKEVYFSIQSFNGVQEKRALQGCFNDVSRVFQGCFMKVSWVLT